MFEMGIFGLKLRCWQGCIHSGGSGANLFPCLFQHLEATSIPWLVVSSSTFKESCVSTSSLSHPDHCICSHISFSDCDSPTSLFHLQEPRDSIGPLRQSWIIFHPKVPIHWQSSFCRVTQHSHIFGCHYPACSTM